MSLKCMLSNKIANDKYLPPPVVLLLTEPSLQVEFSTLTDGHHECCQQMAVKPCHSSLASSIIYNYYHFYGITALI